MASKAKVMRLAKSKDVRDDNVVDDIQRTITNTLSDPAFLLTSLLAAAIIITHMDDPMNGPFGSFFTTHRDNKIVIWLFANFSKVCGLLVMSPTSFRAARHLRNVVFVAVAAAIIALPAYPLWFYIIISAALHLYLHVRGARTRTVILVAIAGYTYFVYEAIKLHVPLNFSDGLSAIVNGSPPGSGQQQQVVPTYSN